VTFGRCLILDVAAATWMLRPTRRPRGGARVRRIGIVALAPKLLVAFWRLVDARIVPVAFERARGAPVPKTVVGVISDSVHDSL
jgi:hypothetical protein